MKTLRSFFFAALITLSFACNNNANPEVEENQDEEQNAGPGEPFSCFFSDPENEIVCIEGVNEEDTDVDNDGEVDNFLCLDGDEDGDGENDFNDEDDDNDGVNDEDDNDLDNDGLDDNDDDDDDNDGVDDDDDDDIDNDGIDDNDDDDLDNDGVADNDECEDEL